MSSGLLARVFDGGGGEDEERGAIGVPDIEDALYPALVECFGIIFLGNGVGRALVCWRLRQTLPPLA